MPNHEATEQHRRPPPYRGKPPGRRAGGVVTDTTEIRWFSDTVVPAGLVDWFTSGGRMGAEHFRLDVYNVEAAPGAGVKRRSQTDLEIKVRRSIGPLIEPIPGWRGRVERWRKWRPSAGDDFVVGDRRWVEVAKTIHTRAYGYDGVHAHPALLPDRTRSGCAVELAALSVGAVEAWTFAFEAFGPAHLQHDALVAAAKAVVLKTPVPPDVAAVPHHNLSYPAWLSGLHLRVNRGDQ